ncbi:Saccharopine dehydrogenase-domain-containing protein [Podospora appendiculata]|uniref:Saccharopine dehydrogenase-domain-containing protein n=1 Tax=Podospora appendiculata TaxID=314037 RepID=A0AAE0XFI6_9PEZI|nr:Saccharopine dehydrogenase-domain-containing protein [Podospora appendiculata]
MPSKQHGRQYDVVVFGASGYTGKYTAQHITTHLPTNLKWALAGRSRAKLEEVAAQCKALNPDRSQPEIEICNLADGDLASLAKKTFVLITLVGPYGKMGEPAFKACAENGTHYLDVTGEVPFVAKMLRKYEAAAKASGAVMVPQIGIESAPSDLVTWSLAGLIRSAFHAPVRDVTVSIHALKSQGPSGGTLSTVLSLLTNFTLADLRAAHTPFALSPIPNPNAQQALSLRAVQPGLITRLTGLVTVPTLGLLTSSIAAKTDAAIVERTWGLLASTPRAYGPNFSFRQYMKPRNWLTGIGIHLGLMLMGLIMVTPFLRRLAVGYVYQPGEGPDVEEAKKDSLEFRGVAAPDVEMGAEGVGRQAFCRAWFHGSAYHLTGILLAEAAATLLEDGVDEKLPGGIYTPACLGQPFIDRLGRAGFHFETKLLA